VAIALSLRLTLKGFQVSKNSSNLKITQQVLCVCEELKDF